MRVFPAIDLREGACVQLVGGSYDDERVREPDPLEASRRFARAGLKEQHVVDLDAALGKGNNADVIAKLAKEPGITLQVGGGVRSEDDVARLLDLGVARVIVGTKAITDRGWLGKTAARFPGKLVVAADVKERTIVVRGWTEASEFEIASYLRAIGDLPLAGALVTAVHVEGKMQGPDVELVRVASTASPLPIFAAGGIGSIADLRAVYAAGAKAAVTGMAIYTGNIDVNELGKELSA
ncbi:MAG TPA: 1-(5-phosphoribosyl)-5-[(5-phosphoribosylamino)methylideneamino] imidazole-4-carboxamide isomerase [Polyangiaceae bacterium]